MIPTQSYLPATNGRGNTGWIMGKGTENRLKDPERGMAPQRRNGRATTSPIVVFLQCRVYENPESESHLHLFNNSALLIFARQPCLPCLVALVNSAVNLIYYLVGTCPKEAHAHQGPCHMRTGYVIFFFNGERKKKKEKKKIWGR